MEDETAVEGLGEDADEDEFDFEAGGENGEGGWTGPVSLKDTWRDRKEAMIFLVDVRDAMHREGHLGRVFRLIASTLKDKIIARENDLVAVVAFGTERLDNEHHWEHVVVLSPLQSPSARVIIRFETWAADPTRMDEAWGHVASSESFQFHHALWVCRGLFSAASTKSDLVRKRLFVFTEDEDPSKGAEAQLALSRTQGRDLLSMGSWTEVVSMKADGFNKDRFFTEVLNPGPGLVGGRVIPFLKTEEGEFQPRARQKYHSLRVFCRSTLSLAPGLDIGVSLFISINPAHKSKAVDIERRTHKPVKKITCVLCDRTGQFLSPLDIRLAYRFCGRTVTFSTTEVTAIRVQGAQGLRLVCFKPVNELKRHHNIRPSYFVYPDEKSRKGSEKLFVCLHSSMVDQQVMAVVSCTIRSTCRYAALLPSVESYDENGAQISSTGFHMIFLPFCDDIRTEWKERACAPSVDEATAQKKLERGAALAAEFIDRLRLQDFSCANYYNPDVQRFYSVLQSMALDEIDDGNLVEIKNTLLSDDAGMLAAAGTLLDQFSREMMGENFDPWQTLERTTGKPRKQEPVSPAVKDEVAIRATIDSALGGREPWRLRVDELKRLCTIAELSTTGRKGDLVARLDNFLSAHSTSTQIPPFESSDHPN